MEAASEELALFLPQSPAPFSPPFTPALQQTSHSGDLQSLGRLPSCRKLQLMLLHGPTTLWVSLSLWS